MTDKLKPCPRCKSEDIELVRHHSRLSVVCCNLCAFYVRATKTEIAIQKWNEDLKR